MNHNTIPKRFIRVWLGNKPISARDEGWWQDFQKMHPQWSFVTILDGDLQIPEMCKAAWDDFDSYSAKCNLLSLIALNEMGGVYIDTDVMPIKPFDPLLEDARPFISRREGNRFELAVIGCPRKHPASEEAILLLPGFYFAQRNSIWGSKFITYAWFNRSDVRKLPMETFLPYDGGAKLTQKQKDEIFREAKWPAAMYAAHFSNKQWGKLENWGAKRNRK